MIYAVILGLLLQFGTTGAAVIIIVYTPTVGLGCRSLGYAVYGGLAIIIMFLNIFSTILARFSEIRKDKSFPKSFTKILAIGMRYISWPLALLNSVGIITLSFLQFSNLLSNCYCNSSALGNGTNTYIVVALDDWITYMEDFRAIGILTALACILVFRVSLVYVSTYRRSACTAIFCCCFL